MRFCWTSSILQLAQNNNAVRTMLRRRAWTSVANVVSQAASVAVIG